MRDMGVSAIGGAGGVNYSPSHGVQAKINAMGHQMTARIASQDDAYAVVSNFGNETHIGSSRFQRDNLKTDRDGGKLTSSIASAGSRYYHVSNFGNETRLGSSRFQRDNDKTNRDGERLTSSIASVGSGYYRVSNFGNELKIGKGEFTHYNDRIFNWGGSNVSSAMRKAQEAYAAARKAIPGMTVDLSA